VGGKESTGSRALASDDSALQNWYVLFPSLNPTGTDTLRWSSSNPNETNISKKEDFNLRYTFGPAPGREWWSLDGKNLELRIPAYEAQEDELIKVFEHPDDPPYYGSYHLVIFDTLHPKEFAEHGKKCKELYESTLYQWVKNGNFAIQYGAQEGTADRTYHVSGAYRRIKSRFRNISALNDYYVAYANKNGYVLTLPDKSVDPKQGYPILCSRGSYGRVSPTVPFCYHVSGTACWWIGKAIARCHAQLGRWQSEGFDGFTTMYIHDELVFDMPAKSPLLPGGRVCPDPKRSNLWRIRILQKLMEEGGVDIGVPTPVSVEYHSDNWSQGVTI
jgi:DNA polymerase I-like protein with 3'-5' exonuclease and polymerase domains